MSDHIAKLEDAIQRLHACEFRHLGSIHVKEIFHLHVGATPTEFVFDGVVDVFEVTNHETASICFAWIAPEAHGGEPIAVLAGQYHKFVDDPHSAVRAWIRYGLGQK
jgi:hypothetical protein